MEGSASPDAYTSLPPPVQSGWIYQPDGTYEIDWEAHEVQKGIQKKLSFYLRDTAAKKDAKLLVVAVVSSWSWLLIPWLHQCTAA